MKIIPLALLAALALFAWRMCAGDVKNAAGGVVETTKNVAGNVAEGTKNVAGNVVDGTKNVAGKVADGTKNVAGKVGDAAGKVGDAAGNAAGKVGDAASNVVQGTKNVAGKAGNAVGNAAGKVGNAAGNAAGKVGSAAKNVVGGAASAVGAAGTKLGEMLTFNKNKFATTITNPRGDISKSFLLDKVTFASGSSDLSGTSSAQLREVADVLKANKNIQIQLQGHTDNVGARGSNVTLSQKRADAVKAFLVKSGVGANRMTSKGFGPDAPRYANDTPDNKRKNRRTELKITKR